METNLSQMDNFMATVQDFCISLDASIEDIETKWEAVCKQIEEVNIKLSEMSETT